MLRRLLILTLTAALLGACSAYHPSSRQHPDSMAQHYAHFDLVLGWDLKVAGDTTQVDGVVKNVRYLYMNDLEIWVAALDPAGKTVARSVSYVIPLQLGMDDTAQFSLKLPVAVAAGSRLRFTYKYLGSDGGGGPEGGGGGSNWWQSFDSVVPAR